MSYISSSNVSVFPSTYRNQYQTSKLTSENNFVNIINAIINRPNGSYVVSHENNVLRLVIHGYYFEVTNWTKSPNLVASIKVENNGFSLVRHDNLSIDNLDQNSIFYGLDISEGNPVNGSDENYTTYSLQITDSSNNIINQERLTTDVIEWGKSGKTLSTRLDELQEQLVVGDNSGLTLSSDKKTLALNLKYKNSLDNLGNKGGSGNKLIYFDNDGVVKDSTSTIGTDHQIVYVNNGTLTAGAKITISNSNPSGGNNGDIWLKYGG